MAVVEFIGGPKHGLFLSLPEPLPFSWQFPDYSNIDWRDNRIDRPLMPRFLYERHDSYYYFKEREV